MTINGLVGSVSYNDEKAQNGDPVVLITGALKAAQGILPVGLILTEKSGEGIPYVETADEVLGTGDGATKAFSGTLTNFPVHPGSVVVGDGTEAFRDDGYGRLVGDAAGTGTIDYETGDIAVSFNANVTNAVDVEVDYVTSIDLVLDEQVDTSKAASGNCIHFGLVRQDVLKIGISAQAAPDATCLKRMRKRHLYAS